MKQIVTMLLYLIAPLLASGQASQGISFSKARNWQEVLEQAKREHKIIFVDAFCTWCGPCKKMDLEVYPDPKVGAFANQNFVPVKIQFDQTAKDPEEVRNWYKDAKYLMEHYSIDAFPTYLFIDGEGNLIEKSVGYQSRSQFLTTLQMANDPKESYTAKIKRFKADDINGQQLLKLARSAREKGDTAVASQIARTYKNRILEKENPGHILSVELRDFVVEFQDLFSINDKFIKYVYRHQPEVDKKLDYKNFSQGLMDYLIKRDFVKPIIKPNGKHESKMPNWNNLIKKLGKTYDRETANRLTLAAKVTWYTDEKDWPNAVKYNIEQVEANGLDTVGIWARIGINSLAYSVIFKYSDDPVALTKGISYMELILQHNPEMYAWIDTYANLLYKVGRKAEAIAHEERALKLAIQKKDKDAVKEFEGILIKMNSNEPTWQ